MRVYLQESFGMHKIIKGQTWLESYVASEVGKNSFSLSLKCYFLKEKCCINFLDNNTKNNTHFLKWI